MKKRLLCAALALALIFSLSFVGCSNRDNSSDSAPKAKVTISVGSAEGSTGDTVKLPVKVSGNPGIMALLIDFKFDAEQLQYIGFEKGKIFSDYETSDDKGIVRLMCIENEDVKGDGEIINLEFKIIGEKKGETEVSVVLEDNSICNYDEELILAKGENGTVKIKK